MPPVPSPPRIKGSEPSSIGTKATQQQEESSSSKSKKALPVVTPALSPKRHNRFSPTGGVSPPPSKQAREKTDEAELLRKKKLMEAEQRMEQMEREAQNVVKYNAGTRARNGAEKESNGSSKKSKGGRERAGANSPETKRGCQP